MNNNNSGMNQMLLRIIGWVTMVFGSCAYVLPDYPYLACFGWIAFPIFAFILADGFEHTISDYKYLLRLAFFGIVSEPLYDLLVCGQFYSPDQQNVMFTLFFAYLAMLLIDTVRSKLDNLFMTILTTIIAGYVALKACDILNTQFAAYGVLFVLLYYFADKVTYPRLLEVLFILYLSIFVSSDAIATISISQVQYDVTIQLFALLATFITWKYNGERGPNSLGLKILLYLVYPAHFVLVYMISLL